MPHDSDLPIQTNLFNSLGNIVNGLLARILNGVGTRLTALEAAPPPAGGGGYLYTVINPLVNDPGAGPVAVVVASMTMITLAAGDTSPIRTLPKITPAHVAAGERIVFEVAISGFPTPGVDGITVRPSSAGNGDSIGPLAAGVDFVHLFGSITLYAAVAETGGSPGEWRAA